MIERKFHDVRYGATDPDVDAAAWLAEAIEFLDRVARAVLPAFTSAQPDADPAFHTQPDFYEVAAFAMRDPATGTGWDVEVSRIPVELLTFNHYDEGYLWSIKAVANGLPDGCAVRADGTGHGTVDVIAVAPAYSLRRIEQIVYDLLDN